MKKINIIKSNDEYNRIIKNYKPYKTKEFLIFVEKNSNEIYQFGFSVSKKIGNAVIRNKIKRQIKNILDKNIYEKSFKCIIMVRRGILDESFNEIEESLNKSLKNIELIKEKNCEEKE